VQTKTETRDRAMRMRGLEPPRGFPHTDLNRARLPIPPHPRLLGADSVAAGNLRTVVEEGKPAPDFELTSDAGETVRLSDLRGTPVVLYFYPRDDTPGCTKQACGIRDSWGAFGARAAVFGVSPDGEASHAKFKAKYSLPFTLLADPDHRVAEAYGFWVEKSLAGKKYMGIERSTVVIDPDGVVSHVFRRVKPDAHAQQVLAAL